MLFWKITHTKFQYYFTWRSAEQWSKAAEWARPAWVSAISKAHKTWIYLDNRKENGFRTAFIRCAMACFLTWILLLLRKSRQLFWRRPQEPALIPHRDSQNGNKDRPWHPPILDPTRWSRRTRIQSRPKHRNCQQLQRKEKGAQQKCFWHDTFLHSQQISPLSVKTHVRREDECVPASFNITLQSQTWKLPMKKVYTFSETSTSMASNISHSQRCLRRLLVSLAFFAFL